MSIKHGNKQNYQLLLDRNRAKIFDDIAQESGIRTTALMREALYEYLEEHCSSKVYEKALELDQNQWRQSVQNRINGRQSARKQKAAETKTNQWKVLFARFKGMHQAA